MMALEAGLRHAGRGPRGRERERVRGSLAAGGMWSGHRAPLTPIGVKRPQVDHPLPPGEGLGGEGEASTEPDAEVTKVL